MTVFSPNVISGWAPRRHNLSHVCITTLGGIRQPRRLEQHHTFYIDKWVRGAVLYGQIEFYEALVKEIIDLIKKVKVHMPQTEANLFQFTSEERLRLAIAYYKKTGDKSRLEELHGELTVQLANLEKK
jgi:hypothetical protein